MAYTHKKLVTFHDSFTPGLKTRVMDMSKLLCEVWLDEPRGAEFKENLKSMSIKEALGNAEIPFPEEFVKFELDTSTYNGSIEMAEELHRGLTFLWKLPYAAWPEKGITESEIRGWIDTVDEWLDQCSEDPNQDCPFPTPPNIYIPLLLHEPEQICFISQD